MMSHSFKCSMKRCAMLRLLGAVLAVVALLVGPGWALADPPEREPGWPAAAVIAEWQEAGAIFGWITIHPQGSTSWWRPGTPGEWEFHREKPAAGGLPAFRFNRFPAGKVKTLAPPDVPFGLWLGSSTKDADLKELAELKQLQALNIEGNYAYGVTAAGLKALAPLTRLQALSLEHTDTGAGMKEIAAPRPPSGQASTSLHIISTSVTDAGMKALPRLKALRTLTILSSGGGVSDAGLSELGGMTQLQSLSLRHTRLKDDHVKVIGGLKQLQTGPFLDQCNQRGFAGTGRAHGVAVAEHRLELPGGG